MSAFFDRVSARIQALNTTLVVGIDPHPADLISKDVPGLHAFCEALIAATRQHAVAYKPNLAFFEAIDGGVNYLSELVASLEPEIPVLLDVKRGDIGSTAAAQAAACYELIGASAVTVHGYLGKDSVLPFVQPNKAQFVLAHTSNPSAATVQHLPTFKGPLYEVMASLALSWSDSVGLVVGATAPKALKVLREAHPNAWFLTPGVGAQGADAKTTVALASRADGLGVLVPISRGISQAQDPQAAARHFRTLLAPVSRVGSAPDRELADLTNLGCLQTGHFVLRSGATSNVYVDCRKLISSPDLLARLATRIAPKLGDVQRVVGVPTAGMPLATAISLVSGLPMLYTRSNAKSHGTKRSVEGGFSPKDRVVLIDDVATAGTSLVQAAKVATAAGLVVVEAWVLVDRQAGAEQALEQLQIPLFSLWNLTDITEQ